MSLGPELEYGIEPTRIGREAGKVRAGIIGDRVEPRRRQVSAIGITDKDRHARPQASVEKGSYACRQHRVVEEAADENYIDLRWRR